MEICHTKDCNFTAPFKHNETEKLYCRHCAISIETRANNRSWYRGEGRVFLFDGLLNANDPGHFQSKLQQSIIK